MKRTPTPRSRGFTLIELLVVSAIIIIITSVVLVSNTRFGGSVQLQNLAYDIALSVRQAQVYGISVHRYETAFGAGFGVHFDSNDPTHYELFADAAGTGLYLASENVAPSPYTIGNGFMISRLCAPAGSDAESCLSVQQIDIIFKRPEPDAWISAGSAGALLSCTQNVNNCYDSARIVVTSPRGDTMSIIVEANGQIAVQH